MVVGFEAIVTAVRRLAPVTANPNAGGSSSPEPSVSQTEGRYSAEADSTGFVPPEERVHQLLSAHEGVTWQGHIVAETDWSAPKTSRVLSGMEAEGEIARYRIGREKVVCLPGNDPNCVQEDRTQPEFTAADRPAIKM